MGGVCRPARLNVRQHLSLTILVESDRIEMFDNNNFCLKKKP